MPVRPAPQASSRRVPQGRRRRYPRYPVCCCFGTWRPVVREGGVGPEGRAAPLISAFVCMQAEGSPLLPPIPDAGGSSGPALPGSGARDRGVAGSRLRPRMPMPAEGSMLAGVRLRQGRAGRIRRTGRLPLPFSGTFPAPEGPLAGSPLRRGPIPRYPAPRMPLRRDCSSVGAPLRNRHRVRRCRLSDSVPVAGRRRLRGVPEPAARLPALRTVGRSAPGPQATRSTKLIPRWL